MCFAPVSHCQYLIVCAARRHGKGSHFHPASAPAPTVVSILSPILSFLSAYLAMDRSLYLVRERSTLRHHLLIRVTESCTPGQCHHPLFSFLIQRQTCLSFSSSHALHLSGPSSSTLLEHCANTITKLWLLDTMQGFGSHAHHAHALFLRASLRNLRGYSSPSAERSGALVRADQHNSSSKI